jgi:hypothetical protein
MSGLAILRQCLIRPGGFYQRRQMLGQADPRVGQQLG